MDACQRKAQRNLERYKLPKYDKNGRYIEYPPDADDIACEKFKDELIEKVDPYSKPYGGKRRRTKRRCTRRRCKHRHRRTRRMRRYRY
jgi:hypothetical protein